MSHPATASGAVDEPVAVVRAEGAAAMGLQVYVSGSGRMERTQATPDLLASWPAPSDRPTTAASAAGLERATSPDATQRLPEIEIDDELGL